MARWHHRPWVRKPSVAAIVAYIRLVERTGRFEFRADPGALDLVSSRQPFIGAFWHGRMMMAEAGWRRLLAAAGCADPVRPCVISSDHADAVLVAEVMRRLGLETRHGSNKRGGLAIYRNALRILRAGRIAVLTPDGPRGPAERVKPGIVRLAGRSGLPIVPISYTARPVVRLNSWDSFLVPLPFARGTITVGAPFWIRPADDPARSCLDLARAISRLAEAASPEVAQPVVASPS